MSGLPYTPDNRPSYHGSEPEVQASYLPYPRHPQSEFGGGASAAGHGKEESDVEEAWSVEPLEGRLSRKLLSKSGLMGKVVDKGNI